MEKKTILLVVFFSIVIIIIGLVIAKPFIQWKWELRTTNEQGRRKSFEETKSFNEGKEQELIRYYREYLTSSDDEKEALASIIRLAFADYDSSKLDPQLRDFLNEIKYK